jgi:uncharacterized membrane protein HdeD (DUF308 family)
MPLPAPPDEKPAEMANFRARGWPVVHRARAVPLGVVSIVAGVIILANPDIGLTTLALLVGIGLLFRGTLEIVVGFTLRGTRGATP